MTVQTVTLHLPDEVYQRLQSMAAATRQPLEDVMYATIRGNLPPTLGDLPLDLREELAALFDLSDEALWAIAREPLPSDQWRRHQRLLRKQEAGSLTEIEQEKLARLREAVDRRVLRRSYALALLKWRGHTLPVPAP